MSVIMRLDRPAVAALIENDPEFKYELQRNVVAEVLKRFIDKDVIKIIVAAHPELMKEALDASAEAAEFDSRVTKALNSRIAVKPPGYAYTFKLTPEFQKLIDDEVDRQLTLGLNALVKARVDEVMAGVTDERIQKLVDYRINVDFDKKVTAKVAERMAAVAAAAAG